MNGTKLLARIAELERAVDSIVIAAAEKPPHEMSDAECVAAVRRLCQMPAVAPSAPAPFTDEEEARILAEWRALRERREA